MFKTLKITPVFARSKTSYRRSGKSCCITPLPYKRARPLFSCYAETWSNDWFGSNDGRRNSVTKGAAIMQSPLVWVSMFSAEGKGLPSAVLYAGQRWKRSASSTDVSHFSVSPSLISHRKCDVVMDFVLCFMTCLQMKLGRCSPWCSKELRIFLDPAMEVFWPSQSDFPLWLADWSISLLLPKTPKAFMRSPSLSHLKIPQLSIP